jgi:hypothetical protein
MTENILDGIDTIVYNDKMWEDIKAVANKQEPPFSIPSGIKVMTNKYLPYETVLLVANNKIVKMIKLLDKKEPA